ncbi:hypothetical protein D3C85_1464390 [compost metagenome]
MLFAFDKPASLFTFKPLNPVFDERDAVLFQVLGDTQRIQVRVFDPRLVRQVIAELVLRCDRRFQLLDIGASNLDWVQPVLPFQGPAGRVFFQCLRA